MGTPGYLSVTACRKGRPFASTSGGRLTGFDVELAAAIARRLGLTLSWRDLPCRTALRAVSSGTLDAVLTPSADVEQGTPASGIALSLHLALVTSKHLAHDERPLLQRLGPGDVVAVVRSRESVAWANDDLRATGAEVRFTDGPADRLRGARGRFGHGRGRRRAGGVACDRTAAFAPGRPEHRRREPMTSSWPRGPMPASWPRSTSRSPD